MITINNRLIVSEKPSSGRALAAVLGAKEKRDGYLEGNGYLISWCFGHLLEPVPPGAYDERYMKWRYTDLPIIPKGWRHKAIKNKEKQLNILTTLLNRDDVDMIINACDAGREGELIFRLVYEHAKCDKPTKRLWISSLEDAAIRAGLENMKDGAAYDNLYSAALCREKADWLIGYNMTRVFSTLYGQTLNCGRVQSPTLAMMAERETEISDFQQGTFYTPILDCGVFTASGEKKKDKADAEAVRAACDGQTAMITSIERQKKSVAPPKLYDLTTLQREANRIYGYTAQQTLDYAQALYEKRLATYPRTDSRFLTEDIAQSLPALVSSVAAVLPFTASVRLTVSAGQVVDNSRVSDHYALIPTLSMAKADLSSLPKGEKNVLIMLAARLLCAVGDKHVYEETVVTINCQGHVFHAKGKTDVAAGWKLYDRLFREQIKQEQDKDAEAEPALPKIDDGQTFLNIRCDVKEGCTAPPRRYTEDTLLAAMESAGADINYPSAKWRGLGTPATRAATIEKLIKAGFAKRDKKKLVPTDRGRNLIAVLPPSLKSATMTALWEEALQQVESGELPKTEFMAEIEAFTAEIVRANHAPNPEYIGLFAANDRKKIDPPIGVCPRCGAAVREGAKGFFCDDRACGFALWADNRFFQSKGKTLDSTIAAALLKDGRVAVAGMISQKTGKAYDAEVVMKDDGASIRFKLDFERGERNG